MRDTRNKKHSLLNKIHISVIIVTRNRPKKLIHCLQALSLNLDSNFEVIIIDQSSEILNSKSFKKFSTKFTGFFYVKSNRKGKSKGLNEALKLTHAPVIAFTDDDCLPDENWIMSIRKGFSGNTSIVALFGRTLPFQQKKHEGFFCPATFGKKNQNAHIISDLDKDWLWIGCGNNMAFRKSLFENLGGFKEWLGPGSLGCNAEDTEIALRCLLAKRKLFYSPKITVYHDRWLTPRENNIQNLRDICGETACFSYFALAGNQFSINQLKRSLKEVFLVDTTRILSYLVGLKLYTFSSIFWWFIKIFVRLRGVFTASWFFYFT
jgi:GT2 family glycosyltransferase